MSEHDDDLARWADDDLVRALRAPGTTQELAEQETYVAGFREARRARSGLRSLPRRAAGRLGAGGTAVVVTVALTSGVAAAYTGHLPDPVQRVMHSVLGPIGVSAPDPAGSPRHRPRAASTQGGTVIAPLPTGATDPTAPATGTTRSGTTAAGATTAGPTPAGVGGHAHHRAGAPGPTNRPTGTPSTPTTSPTSSPTSGPGAAPPSALSMGGLSHRVVVGQTVTLSSLLTAADGSPLPGHLVVLLTREGGAWHPVAEATTDSSGTVAVTTPPVTRSGRFRWHTDHRVHSAAWPVRMVPTMTASASVGGIGTVVDATTQGGSPGDRVLLLRWAGTRLVRIGHGALDQGGAATLEVTTPPRRATYVVRLLPTRRHAGAKVRLAVQPPTAAAVSISASADRVPVGGSIAVSGVVRAADGSGLAERRVVLQVRGPARWRTVATGTTDAGGSVTLPTPAARTTARYRLHARNGAHSIPWRVVMMPVLSATTSPDGSVVDVDATARGGRGGDRVVLLRRVAGRLVKVQHASLGAAGSVTFRVAPRTRASAYVVRLLATRRHGWAVAHVQVPGTG